MKKLFSGILFALLLISMFVAAFQTKAGSVDSASALGDEPLPVTGTFTTVMSSNTTSWDANAIGAPFVLFDAQAGLYKMWYGAKSQATQIGSYWSYRNVIGYAESYDGVTWFNKQVVHDTGPPSSYFYDTGDPFVLKENGELQNVAF